MVNLEWLRTFRTVYKAGSLTKAADLLSITQPAVSQHIAALEVQTGKKMFIRKSKGVEPSDYARTFNNMVANSLDDLEDVEALLRNKSIKHDPVISIGISEHLYESALCDRLYRLGNKIHVSFGSTEKMIKATEEGNLNYAIIPKEVTNFDTNCHLFLMQELILVYTPDIDMSSFEHLFDHDRKRSERWLSHQQWYSHATITPFIKQFWMDVFDKKRPEIVPHRVIPNEALVLEQLAKGSGIALCFDTTARSYLKAGTLLKSKVNSAITRDVALLTNRKKENSELSHKLLSLLSE